MIQAGDYVRLRAGGEAMRVGRVERGCDGTGGDGAGLLCIWESDRGPVCGWISESSVELVQ